jgi:hypothetical protein
MAIVCTAANVRPVNPNPGDVVRGVLNGTVTAGQLVYHNGTGWVENALSSAANGAGIAVALEGGASGATVDLLMRGQLTGWTGLDDGKVLYTAASGAVDDQAHPQYAVAIGFSLSDTNWYFSGYAGDAHGS